MFDVNDQAFVDNSEGRNGDHIGQARIIKVLKKTYRVQMKDGRVFDVKHSSVITLTEQRAKFKQINDYMAGRFAQAISRAFG